MKPRFGAQKSEHRVGRIAASPVTFDSTEGWFGLGPVSVLPDQLGNGIGSALIKATLNQLKQAGAVGTVVLGEPEYYSRFGFKQIPGLFFLAHRLSISLSCLWPRDPRGGRSLSSRVWLARKICAQSIIMRQEGDASRLQKIGAPERNRTSDTGFRRAVLYPLSY